MHLTDQIKKKVYGQFINLKKISNILCETKEILFKATNPVLMPPHNSAVN